MAMYFDHFINSSFLYIYSFSIFACTCNCKNLDDEFYSLSSLKPTSKHCFQLNDKFSISRYHNQVRVCSSPPPVYPNSEPLSAKREAAYLTTLKFSCKPLQSHRLFHHNSLGFYILLQWNHPRTTCQKSVATVLYVQAS